MANGSYKVEAEISTSNSVSNLRNLNKAIEETSTALRALNTVTKEGEANLKSMVSSITGMLSAYRQAAQAEKELAQAKLATAKATAAEAAEEDRHAESVARTAAANARAKATEAQATRTSAATAQDALRTENQLANGYVQREAAQERLTLSQQRYSASQERAKQNELELQDKLSNTRYLLYDVTATYRMMSIALEAIPVATATVAAAYQRDFAQVLRIADKSLEQTQSLRAGLVDLTTAIPVSFDQATQIAQLGAHLQMSNDGLVQFTDTVAKFTAATGVSAEASSQLFSRMKTAMADSSESGSQYFNKLGSSIAQMGTVVVATDQEVASMVTQINAVTASAGIGTSATVGLAGAMASLRIAPEMARGALTRLFAGFNRAAAEGAEGMQQFGNVMGVSAQQAQALWKSDPTQFFTQFVGGLHNAYEHGQNLTALFDDMHIKNVRDVNTLTRLAVGYEVVGKSMDAANKGFEEGSALDQLSKPVFETAVAKLQELGSAFGKLGDALGSGALAPLAVFADLIKGVVSGLSDLAKTQPAIMFVINALLGLAAVAGVFLGLKAAQAAVLAGIVGFQQVMGSAAAKTLNTTGILKQFAAAQLMAKGATEQQAQAIVKQTSALGALATAASLNAEKIAAMATSTEAAGVASVAASTRMGSLGGAARGVLSAVGGLVGGLPGLISLVGIGLVGALVSAETASDNAAKSLGETLANSAADGAKAAGDAIKAIKVGLDSSGGEGFNFGDYGKSLDQIANRAGISIDKMVTALAKGKQGYEDFRNYLDRFAKDNGFKDGLGDFGLANSGPGTKGAEIYFVAQAMERLHQKSDEAAASAKQVDDSVAKAGGAAEKAAGDANDLADGFDESTKAADKFDKALKAINDDIFGTINMQANLGDALAKLGEGLQKSGQFNNSENGRANIKNLEDALKNAQEYYGLLEKAGQLTAGQASSGYADFVEQLLGKVKAQGGNLGPIEDLAHQTVARFKNIVGADTSGAKAPTVNVQANTAPAVTKVVATTQAIQSYVSSVQPQLRMGITGDDNVKNKFVSIAQDIAQITGKPVQFILDALTNPASQHAQEVQQYIVDIVNGKYNATIDANTKPAAEHVNAFYNDAMAKLMAVQNYVNGLAATAPTLAKYAVPGVQPKLTGVPYKPTFTPTVSSAPDPAQAAVLSNNALVNTLGNVDAGYKKAQASADKAGEKGKKAGKDTADAWKDAGDGISEATAKADDYASRLKTGLERAFESQYGLQIATDAYYQKLNAIKKAREDELKQVDDLRDKIKSLNNDRNGDLIDASKNQMEARISTKYGEADRAMDYQNKAQTALDNAAAKQKEIDADTKQANEIQAGIGLLTGYSDAAIKNRQDLRELEKAQLDMVVAYAKTGASIDQVRAYAANLNGQFQRDVGQIGFNQIAVQNLTGDLGRYIDVINRVPYLKPTTVTADTTQAEDALNDLGNDFNTLGDEMQTPIEVNLRANWDWNVEQLRGTDANPIYSAISDQLGVNKAAGYTKANFEGGPVMGFDSGGLVPGTPPSNPRQDNMLARVDGKGIVGIRSREFIMPQEAVDYYGTSTMEAMRKMRLPRFNFGGSVGGGRSAGATGVQVVELTAEQLAYLGTVMGREVKLFADTRVLAEAVSRGNREIASEGGRRG